MACTSRQRPTRSLPHRQSSGQKNAEADQKALRRTRQGCQRYGTIAVYHCIPHHLHPPDLSRSTVTARSRGGREECENAIFLRSAAYHGVDGDLWAFRKVCHRQTNERQRKKGL